MFAIEDYVKGTANPTNNPNYHRSSDTLDTLNLAFHAEATRGLLAAVAHFANTP